MLANSMAKICLCPVKAAMGISTASSQSGELTTMAKSAYQKRQRRFCICSAAWGRRAG